MKEHASDMEWVVPSEAGGEEKWSLFDAISVLILLWWIRLENGEEDCTATKLSAELHREVKKFTDMAWERGGSAMNRNSRNLEQTTIYQKTASTGYTGS